MSLIGLRRVLTVVLTFASVMAQLPSTAMPTLVPPLAAAAGPDLIVTAFTAPASVIPGGTATYTWTITNQGDATANAVTTGPTPQWGDQVWLSTSPTSVAGARGAGGIVAPNSLNAGSSYTRTFSATVPSNVPPGSYYWILQTDSNGQIAEGDETNNLSASVPVTVAAPLVVNTITDTEDDAGCTTGHCSLREALRAAENSGAPDVITFAAALNGATIAIDPLLGQLPALTGADRITGPAGGVTVAGWKTAYGDSVTSGLVVSSGAGAEISGIRVQGFDRGFHVTGSTENAVLRGVTAVRNTLQGIRIDASGAGNKVLGSFIGTDAAGSAGIGNGPPFEDFTGAGYIGSGIVVAGAGAVQVGGSGADERNVISGNVHHGVSIGSAAAHVIRGNYIGLKPDGLTPLRNVAGVWHEIWPVGPSAAVIDSNVVSGNHWQGIVVQRAQGVTVSNNTVGVAADGSAAGNGSVGIAVDSDGSAMLTGNTVANTGGGGVRFFGTTVSTAVDNVVRNNAGPGFDISGSADAGSPIVTVQGGSITANAGKGIARSGGASIPAPIVTSVQTTNGLVVSGTGLAGSVVAIYTDPSDEGAEFLGTTVVTDSGTWAKSTGWAVEDTSAIRSALRAGTRVVTATQTTDTSGTSEFSAGLRAPAAAAGIAQYRETPDGTATNTLILGGATVTVRSAAGAQPTAIADSATGAFSFTGLAANTAHLATYDLTAPTGRRYLVQVPFTTDARGGAAIPPPAPVFNRKNHGWLTAFRIGDGVPVPDQISREGQATWYRLAIAPQTQVTINVTGCTFDCNVVVYRDLFQVAAALKAGSTTLSGIRTDLAGNIAADDMDADDMDADDMDADDMDADDMDADDMDADDMDADDMDADDMDADDMDADDMDADDMDADDMDADDMDADNDGLTGYGPVYLAAQRKGVRAASVSEGLAPETITINTRSLTGDLFIRVKGDTVTDIGTFSVSALRAPQASCIGAPLIARAPSTAASAIPSGKRSLILTDSSAFAPTERAQVLAKLGELAGHATVDGHVLDLATDANIAALRADWLAKPTCVAQANLLTDAIRAVVQLARTRGPLEYLIIGGGDRIVPFRREADWAEIARESRYSPPVLGSSPSDASLVSDTILTDDFYATASPIERVNRTLYLPDIAVGRLVESAADIGAYVDMYIAQNGRATPTTALSSGYDFNLDLAQYVTTQLQSSGLAVNSSLVGNTWSADQWRATVLSTADRFGILSLQGHFSANRLVPADNGQRVLSTEIAGLADGRFRGALVYSLGCHSGYSIADPDALLGLTQPVAFPEAFVRQGATLVGGTGYQYGETVLMKNTEALIALLTTELGYSTDARGVAYGAAGVPIGKALMYAKRAYMGDTATPRGIDFKVVGVSTVYGSPTMSFKLPSSVARPQPGTVSPDFSSGVGVLDVTTATTPTRVGAVGSPSYYTGASGTTVAPYRPIAPLVTIPAEATGSVLAGVVFMGGTYTEETGFVPQLSIPATEQSGEAPRYVNDTFSPTRPVRTNLFDGDAVQLIPFQYRSDATGTAGTARVFNDVRYRAYYSSVTGAAAIVDAPPIERVSVSMTPTGVTPSGIQVRASVRGHTLAGIADVYVTYTDTSALSRSFTSVRMSAGTEVSDGAGFSGFTREYTAVILSGANAAAIRFMVQAVSGTGRVEVAANGGQLFSTLTGTAASAPADVAPKATQLTIAASPQAPAYRSPLVASAMLSGLADGQLAGRPITFSFGGASRTGLTNASGAASATFDVQATPGTHQLTASYAGGTGVLGSSASTVVQVQRAAASLIAVPANVPVPGTGTIARLSAGGVTLNEQPIVLRALGRSIATTTDFSGEVRFDTADFPGIAGRLEVTLEYAGNQRYLGASATVVVTLVDPRTFVTAGGWVETSGGRANVVIDARHHKGQSLPNGKVQVQTDGKLQFRSTSIEWLTIVGDTVALAGEGTVNGKAGYRYLVEATDAASDTVSVKIWEATGSAANPTHTIAGTLKGGTVKIHR